MRKRAELRMKVKKTTPKMSGLVVAALRNLRDAHGSTAKEIMKYIMAEYNASEAVVQRQLKTALKRGVEYGILKKTTAGYSLNTDAEVIGPLDLAQMDACGKKRKRMSCKPKRRGCPPKKRSCPKKRKRSACPRRRKKKNPCGMCAARGRRGDCGGEPVNLPATREGSPNMAANEDEDEELDDAMAPQQPNNSEANNAQTRSRSNSRGRNDGARSRSQSLADSEEQDYEPQDDDM